MIGRSMTGIGPSTLIVEAVPGQWGRFRVVCFDCEKVEPLADYSLPEWAMQPCRGFAFANGALDSTGNGLEGGARYALAHPERIVPDEEHVK